MQKYAKFLVAALGFVLTAANVMFANDPRVQAFISLATAFGVYSVANKPSL